MLPDSCFHPLDLNDAVDAAYGGDSGEDAKAARELIERALLDPRSQGDDRVFSWAWEACEFFDDEEGPAAAAMLGRVRDAHPSLRIALGALWASWLDDKARQLAEITRLHSELMAMPEESRDLRFYLIAPGLMAREIGDEARGIALAEEGLAAARAKGDDALVAEIQQRSPSAEHRKEPSKRFTSELDRLVREKVAEQSRRQGQPVIPQGGKVLQRMAYFPAAEYTRGLEQGLFDATYPAGHEDYRREMQAALVSNSVHGGRQKVVPLTVDAVREFAVSKSVGPGLRQTVLSYLDTVSLDAGAAWPPERNAACWCQSGRKYKKCCGRPGFADEPVPDRGQSILRVELDGLDVWRQVAVPHTINLDELAHVLMGVMGWNGDHLYAFEPPEGLQIMDPRATRAHITADLNELSTIARAPGDGFTWEYDFGDSWLHSITLEEIRAVDPEANEPVLLGGAGACPPDDSGGVPGYLAKLEAFKDPSHPEHDYAVEWLGPDWDPARIS